VLHFELEFGEEALRDKTNYSKLDDLHDVVSRSRALLRWRE